MRETWVFLGVFQPDSKWGATLSRPGFHTPASTAFPVRKIIGDTLFSSLISRFAVYTRIHHRWRKGTPVFEQMRFPKIEMGDFRGVKLGLPPISLIDPYFQKVKRVLKKVY